MGEVADAVSWVTLIDDDEPTFKNVVACLQEMLGITEKKARARLSEAIHETHEVEVRILKVKVPVGEIVGSVSAEVLGMQGELFGFVNGEVFREVTAFRLVVPPPPFPVCFIERVEGDDATA